MVIEAVVALIALDSPAPARRAHPSKTMSLRLHARQISTAPFALLFHFSHRVDRCLTRPGATPASGIGCRDTLQPSHRAIVSQPYMSRSHRRVCFPRRSSDRFDRAGCLWGGTAPATRGSNLPAEAKVPKHSDTSPVNSCPLRGIVREAASMPRPPPWQASLRRKWGALGLTAEAVDLAFVSGRRPTATHDA